MSLVLDRTFDSGACEFASASQHQAPVVETGHWLAGLLDQIDYGLVVLDPTAAALHVNRAAQEWLASAAAPLRINGRHLEAVTAQDSGPFRRALAGAVSRGRRALLTFGEGCENVAACVRPLPGGRGTVACLALLVIGRRQVCDALTAQMFASSHGLTCAESHVLELLCTGLAPREVARRQGVAMSTVRSHIGSIRSKTHARTIGTLVRKVALLPPLGPALTKGPAPAVT